MNEVKPDDSGSDPDMEEDATEVSQILEDPNPDNFSVNGVLSFDKDNTGNCFGVEDFNGEALCGFGTNSGTKSSYITQDQEHELNLGVLDGILDEIDEDLDYADGCEDYLLDIDLVQEVSALDSGLCDGIRLGNSSSDSHSPGYSASSNGAVGMSDSSAITNSDIIHKDDLNHKSEYDLSHGASRVRTSRSKHNREKSYKISLDDEKFKDCQPSVKNENSPEAVNNVREKRQRKPPRRYIEESSNIKTESHPKQGQKLSAVVSKVKDMKVGSVDGQYHATPRLSAFVSDDVFKEPYGGGSTQRQLLKKHIRVTEFSSVEDSSGTDSELEFSGNKSKKKKSESIDRRKHQRMWTLQEVVNLVDGIAKYGVGRWTDIKRLSFASAPYRTPIDLRDKWRNLLRASRAHRSDREENDDDDERQSSGRLLPKSLLRQVNELASVHPYPRKDRSRSSPSTSAKERVATWSS